MSRSGYASFLPNAFWGYSVCWQKLGPISDGSSAAERDAMVIFAGSGRKDSDYFVSPQNKELSWIKPEGMCR